MPRGVDPGGAAAEPGGEATLRDGGSHRGVRTVYSRGAREYDRRWSRYLDATLSPLAASLPTLPGTRLLDVGCGTGLLLEMLLDRQPALDAWGVDLTPEMIRRAYDRLGPRARLMVADAAEIPAADDAFDIVVSASSVHHWRRPEAAFREIARTARPGALVAVTDWCADHLPTRLRSVVLGWSDPAHHRTYTTAECERMLTGAGLQLLSTTRFQLGWAWGFMTLIARAPGRAAHGSH